MLDGASQELSRLRRAVRVAHSRLMDRLNSFVSGGRFGPALQENIITIRDGRYVVPVKAEARGLIRGNRSRLRQQAATRCSSSRSMSWS